MNTVRRTIPDNVREESALPMRAWHCVLPPTLWPTLSAMADHAAPVFDVVSDRRMAAKRFGDGRWVLQILLGHGHVTRRAAIDYGEFAAARFAEFPK